ncbi:MAG: glutamate--tRNA ligase family protein, partial [Candidatus Nanoarchaeia archaeon]|nr:glutamate--tRNA ligase family protein [Candidatus Nanoarchaeia archaeon]
YGGEIILVMDDTIGSVEKPLVKEGYDLIEDAFKWLKIKYNKIIYKSDRLKIYYKYCEELIEKNKAYVCHCNIETLRANRKKGVECGCRQFPPGIQLARWKEMFGAKEGSAVVRIKTEMTHKNPAFRDRVLFKISDRKHPRVGNKYRVWPSLEMSWAVDDHELGITHIIRGNDLLMETEMEKYIWDIFKWDYSEAIHTGKIAIAGVTIAKSKAQKEVLSGEFIGWDDPRTWSIQSLERRGIKSKSIRQFVEEIGLNKQDITVPIEALYAINRRALDEDALRYSFVEAPIKLDIENEMSVEEIEVPIHPHKEEVRKVKVGKDIFISEEDWEKYRGKEIRLLHLFNVTLGDKTKITSVDNKKISKINWVSENVKTEIFMPDGKTISGLAESSVKDLKVGEMIQFERFGFVRYDGKKDETYNFWFAHK